MKKLSVIFFIIITVCYFSANIGCKKSKQTAKETNLTEFQKTQTTKQEQEKEPKKIWWEHRINKEVVFVEMDKSVLKQKYFDGYDLYKKPCLVGCYGSFPYKKYVGKRGKIIGVVKSDVLFWKIKLETGETVYAEVIFGEEGPDRDKIEYRNYQIKGMYFTEDFNIANKKVGKCIWVNRNRYRYLRTDIENEEYPLKHLEKLKIINVVPKVLYPYDDILYLKVQRETGEIGLIGNREYNYFETYPIDPTWDRNIIEAIENQQVLFGMTKEQVILSWDRPEDINRTVTQYGIHEQWIYFGPKYLYFENNKLTSYQD